VPGTVVGVMVIVAFAVLVESVWEVAVTVTLVGRPSAASGDVYVAIKGLLVVATIVPLDAVQVTPWVEFVTVAVNDTV
jgi:hypothetical protein